MMIPTLGAIGMGALLPESVGGQAFGFVPTWFTDLLFAIAAVRILVVALFPARLEITPWCRDAALWAASIFVAALIMLLASRLLPTGWEPMHATVLARGPLMPLLWAMVLWWPACEIFKEKRREVIALIASLFLLSCSMIVEIMVADDNSGPVTIEVLPVLNSDGDFHDLDGLMKVVGAQSVFPYLKEAQATGRVGPYEGVLVGVRSGRIMTLQRTVTNELELVVEHPAPVSRSFMAEILSALGVLSFFTAFLTTWSHYFRLIFRKFVHD
jgi:hypothetical protein